MLCRLCKRSKSQERAWPGGAPQRSSGLPRLYGSADRGIRERELWSGWNDGDNLRRLPGGGGRVGHEI